MTMRILLVLAAIIGFSGYASAQTTAPSGGKPLKRVTPSAPMGCKLVGTVKEIWAGDCAAASELRGITPSVEPSAPAPTPEVNPAANNKCENRATEAFGSVRQKQETAPLPAPLLVLSHYVDRPSD